MKHTLRLIEVRRRPGRSRHHGILRAGNRYISCSLGRTGIGAGKIEGDGKTPRGTYKLINGLFRKDRLNRNRWQLPMRKIGEHDGWCDEPNNRNYNRLVRLPYPASAETLKRQDGLYDVCIVLDYNINKRKRNAGSAIFFHLSSDDDGPTEGCVAIPKPEMLRLMPIINNKTRIRVR